MKTFSRLFFTGLFILSLAFLNACGKDTVSPYVPSETSGTTDAKDIEYSGTGYTYNESGPSEESLDNSGGMAGTGNYGMEADQIEHLR